MTDRGIEQLKRLDLYEQIGILYDLYEASELLVPYNRYPVTIEEAAQEIVTAFVELSDRDAPISPEGQTCARCDREAVQGPGNEWFCEEHHEEFFRERHG